MTTDNKDKQTIINEGITDWIVNLIVNNRIKAAEDAFSNDKLLQQRFKEFRIAEEKLRALWNRICKDREGTYLDCEEMMKKKLEFDKSYYGKQGKDYRDYL